MAEVRTRKRTSQACLPCGRRKTRCDGAVPSCRQCQAGGRKCHYGKSVRNKIQKRDLSHQPCNSSGGNLGQHTESDPQGLPSHLEDGGRNNDSSIDGMSVQGTHNSVQDRALRLTSEVVLSTTQAPPAPGDELVVSWDVSHQLFTTYFAFIHPVWPIIYKPMYECTDYRSPPHSLPQPVVYAIYSIAACLKPGNTGSSPSVGQQVLEPAVLYEAALRSLQRSTQFSPLNRSHSLSPLHLLRPSIDSCQALTILALQQHGCAEPSNAFMLCSLASAMAIELELHKAASSDADPTFVQIASRLWWNLFVLDKMIACELGRPVSLRSEDSSTHLPSIAESDEYQLLLFQVPRTNSTATVKSYTISGFHATIGITRIMEKVARQIYSLESREILRNDLHSAERLRLKLWQELKDYYTKLEKDNCGLQLDQLGTKVLSPASITNAVWAWTTTIMVHRPFYFYWQSQGWRPAEPLQAGSQPLEVCFCAAENICQILESHVENLQRFPCDLIFPIFTTASTLSHYRQVNQGGKDDSITSRLAMCIKWLSILGSNWKNAGSSKEKLTKGMFYTQFQASATSMLPTKSDAKDLGIASKRDVEQQAAAPVQGLSHRNTPIQTQAQEIESVSQGDATIASEDSRAVEGLCSIDDLGQNMDWAFLHTLGDANDEFYAMDTDFRDFLGSGCEFVFDPALAS